jgi:hypothetical protein
VGLTDFSASRRGAGPHTWVRSRMNPSFELLDTVGSAGNRRGVLSTARGGGVARTCFLSRSAWRSSSRSVLERSRFLNSTRASASACFSATVDFLNLLLSSCCHRRPRQCGVPQRRCRCRCRCRSCCRRCAWIRTARPGRGGTHALAVHNRAAPLRASRRDELHSCLAAQAALPLHSCKS